ncbi:meiosis initiator protein-like isoform X2 [Polyodon spathula]|uniref:meiosis initiator protein-like isoform X2 n=1 Tax=Polyodon spathula TaxID=7913 RepID=UPI001B7EB32C|nr:meiosis initiator protein-like isoform X2 [Polyodon spathula]
MKRDKCERSDSISQRKRKEHHDFTLSLREIAALLPLTGTAHSCRITKKDTLVHVLRYLEYLQSHIDSLETLLPGCDSGPSDPRTPPLNRKSARRKSVCSRPRKRQPASRGSEGEGCNRRRRLYGAESRWDDTDGVELSDWPVFHNIDSSSPHPNSQDSVRSCSQTPGATATPTDLGAPPEDRPCSACGEQRGSEEGRPVRSQVFDSPHTGSGGLLNDHMLWWYPSSGEDEPSLIPSSPPHPSTGSSPLRTLCFGEDLNLSPSLLTSPARDLTVSFLQEGQENLHVLFEDVWVSAKHSAESQEHSADNTAEWDSLLGGGWLSSASEGEEQGDFTWTPSKRGPPRGGRGRHRPRPQRPLYTQPHLKKKCVNGFIMYCRMNRKSYLRVKARRFSRQENRNVCSLWSEGERDGEGQERGRGCRKERERGSRREGEQRSDQSRLFRGDSRELLPIGPAAGLLSSTETDVL